MKNCLLGTNCFYIHVHSALRGTLFEFYKKKILIIDALEKMQEDTEYHVSVRSTEYTLSVNLQKIFNENRAVQ